MDLAEKPGSSVAPEKNKEFETTAGSEFLPFIFIFSSHILSYFRPEAWLSSKVQCSMAQQLSYKPTGGQQRYEATGTFSGISSCSFLFPKKRQARWRGTSFGVQVLPLRASARERTPRSCGGGSVRSAQRPTSLVCADFGCIEDSSHFLSS